MQCKDVILLVQFSIRLNPKNIFNSDFMGKVKYEDFVQTLKDTSVNTDHKGEQDNNIYMTLE